MKYWVNRQLWQSEILSELITLTVWNIEWTDNLDSVKYLIHLQPWQSEVLCPPTTLTEWSIVSADNFDREKYWVTDNIDRVKDCVRRQLRQREVLSHWQPWQSKVFCSLTTLTELWQNEVFSPLTTLTEWNIEWIDNVAGCEILSQLTALTEWNIEWTENYDRVKYWVHRQLIFMCCSISAWCHEEQERCYRNKLLNWIKDFTYVKWYYH